MTDWLDIEYLKSGNDRQRNAHRILKEIDIFSVLRECEPVLVGTIPIGIDISGSDLDIICNAADLSKFQEIVRGYFSKYQSFSDYFRSDSYVASFEYKKTPIEIYAESKPTTAQHGYRHMLIEDRILKLAGDDFRNKIIELKTAGYKTEPAFGILLKLENPYSDLLNLESLSDNKLNAFIQSNLTN
ncbi:DUF4269 domain-containing protein [Prevotella sp. 10(H)]|uniref:DUF4269 domain-containing protein n=1 Tax=Prevotella sp. 10(H) TaxID=1158294 RepID=UPI0004A6B7CF|nr:DUF4269 domain-containing protein [Prevotella sp. 10(H)]